MKKILIFFWLLRVIDVNAQAPQRFFTRFGGDGDDIAYSGKPTNDGQYIIAGSSSSYGVAGNTDVYLVKVDSMGFPMWQKFFGGIGNDIGRSVIQLPDSGYMIAGFTNSFGAGGYDVFVIRTDKHGNKIWQETYGGSDWDFAYDLVRGSDGNVFIVGNTSSFGGGKMDGYILKIDLLGNLILQKTVGGLENDELKSIINTNDYNLATVGSTQSMGDINGDGYFLKLDLNADTLFTKTFGGPYKDYATDIVQKGFTENFEYYISGAKTYSLNTSTHSYVRRYSTIGKVISDTSDYRFNGDKEFVSVTNSSAFPYITCLARSVIISSKAKQEEVYEIWPDMHPQKINDAGDSGDEYVFSIESTKDGGYLTVGSTSSFNSIGQDVFLVKRDSTVLFYSSVVDVKNFQFDFDQPLVSVLNNQNSIELKFNEYQNKKVELLDLLGHIFISAQIENNECFLDCTGLTSGIYMLFIEFQNGETYKKKLILR